MLRINQGIDHVCLLGDTDTYKNNASGWRILLGGASISGSQARRWI